MKKKLLSNKTAPVFFHPPLPLGEGRGEGLAQTWFPLSILSSPDATNKRDWDCRQRLAPASPLTQPSPTERGRRNAAYNESRLLRSRSNSHQARRFR